MIRTVVRLQNRSAAVPRRQAVASAKASSLINQSRAALLNPSTMRLFHRHTNCKPSYILSLGRLSNAALGKVQVRFYSTDNDSKKDDSDDKSRDKRRNDFFHGFRRPSSGRQSRDAPPPSPFGGGSRTHEVPQANMSGSEIDWTTFVQQLLERGEVEKLLVFPESDMVYVYIKGQRSPTYRFRIGSVESLEKSLRHIQDRNGVPYEKRVVVQYERQGLLSTILSVIPGMLMVCLLLFLTASSFRRAGGFFPIDPARKSHLVTAENKPKMRFADVAGMQEAKTEIMEFVSFLKNPQKYRELGAKIPRGALLVGPPGTGKTLLAKATAGEAGVPFFSMSGSDFVEMFVGVGPARVRELFAQARQKAPCIIFIDEIDAVGRKRSKGGFYNDERENTLNQLLVEMDGFSTTSGVIVLAGTNRQDILDKALMRPGRFDRVITIDPPDKPGRVEIFKVHLKPLKLDKPPEEYAEKLATLTPGFVGADIANVCNEAALIAARNGKTAVEYADLEAAIERVLGGLEKKTKILPPKEKRTVAYHEAGHAVAGWFLEHASPLLKVSIIPRGNKALGYAQYQPKEQFLYSKEQLMDIMCMTIGGRCAEALVLGKISSGAEDDLEKITKMAYNSVTKYGMSKSIGLVSFTDDKGSEFPVVERIFSSETAQMIDEEVRKIVQQVYDRTYKLLEEHREGLEAVAQLLLEKEVLHQADLERLLGPRPFPANKGTTSPEGGVVESAKDEQQEQGATATAAS